MAADILGDYETFVKCKASAHISAGFEPGDLPNHLFDFQTEIVKWACLRGRAAIFADTGLGKTAMQTAWADQVVNNTDGRVLILAPLCVAQQTVEEAARWGIDITYARSQEQTDAKIVITNYEMVDKFNPADFAGVVLDESSILKSHDSKAREAAMQNLKKSVDSETGYKALPTGLAGLKQAIANAVATAGGDEVAELLRLDRMFAKKVSA